MKCESSSRLQQRLDFGWKLLEAGTCFMFVNMAAHLAVSGAEKPIFRDLSADDPDPEVTEIESLCMNCGENGTTRLLLTRIPFYKEVIMMSFACDKCGLRNNELQSSGTIEPKGIRTLLRVQTPKDLNRQVVKSDFTSVLIPELDFEIPAQSQKGEVTTVEGVINRALAALEQDQSRRSEEHPEDAAKVGEFVKKLLRLKDMATPFNMVFRDISGNCFVENPFAPASDRGVETSHFARSRAEDNLLGMYSAEQIDNGEEPSRQGEEPAGLMRPIADGTFKLEDMHGEVHTFQTNCPHCGAPAETNMKVTDIPHFKEVLIMATNCEACGQRSNEVKSGGGIEPKGLRIEVKVAVPEDFTRDVLKAETCSLSVPELDLEVGGAALGGRFTTVEGILAAMREQLASRGHMFGDSADVDAPRRMDGFLERFDRVLACQEAVTLVLDDPAGNSYVQSLTFPDADPRLTITQYERSFHHNEELGLNDMKTENYEET